jgi:hypothetical protein
MLIVDNNQVDRFVTWRIKYAAVDPHTMPYLSLDVIDAGVYHEPSASKKSYS